MAKVIWINLPTFKNPRLLKEVIIGSDGATILMKSSITRALLKDPLAVTKGYKKEDFYFIERLQAKYRLHPIFEMFPLLYENPALFIKLCGKYKKIYES
jgi:hypothetical protein